MQQYTSIFKTWIFVAIIYTAPKEKEVGGGFLMVSGVKMNW